MLLAYTLFEGNKGDFLDREVADGRGVEGVSGGGGGVG